MYHLKAETVYKEVTSQGRGRPARTKPGPGPGMWLLCGQCWYKNATSSDVGALASRWAVLLLGPQEARGGLLPPSLGDCEKEK